MKNLQTILAISLTIAVLALFYSCSQDTDLLSDTNAVTDIESRSDNVNPREVSNNGKWLVFSNKRAYDNTINSLRISLNDSRGEVQEVYLTGSNDDHYGATYDSQPQLALFEQSLDFSSYRKRKELLEEAYLREGMDPSDITETSINPLNITSPIMGSLISENGVIQIEKDIFVALNRTKRVRIKNNRTDLVDALIESGDTRILYEDRNIGDVEFQNKAQGSSVVTGFICTADFEAFPGGINQDDKSAAYTFLWNDGDASGATNIEFTWNFGDGSPSETGTTSFATHTYENLEPHPAVNSFVVCVQVTYTYLDDDGESQTCNQASCQTISVTLEEQPDPCDNVTEAMSIIGISGTLDNILQFTTVAGGGQVCVGLGPIAGAIANLSGVTYEWTAQGQTITSASPCFPVTCDGSYPGSLTIKKDGVSCYTNTFTFEYSGGDADCQLSGDLELPDNSSDEIVWQTDDDKKTKIRAKHQTRKDNGLFNWGGNQVEGEITSYKRRSPSWLGWKKEERTTTITMVGNVYPQEDGCACGGEPGFMNETWTETRKNHYQEKPMFVSSEGIYARGSDPYTVRLIDGPVDRTLQFPQ